MLACLPRPGDLPLQLLPHTQMNAGPQKWDTTQRMSSSPFPTPAELDAYAHKVANNPLTIKIFPNSIKVPQRNHVRRTVNGLDTSGPRYSPYPPNPLGAKTGLLAVVKAPAAKSIVKDFAGGRTCLHPEVMSTVTGAYQVASTSTLNHRPTLPNLPRAQQSSRREPPQTLLMPLHPHTKNLRHPSLVAPHPQGPTGPKTVSHQPAHSHREGPSTVTQQHLQPRPPPGLQVHGKLPDNVSVSTSTFPRSMFTGLLQNHQADLSIIVHQINQLCQVQAHGGETTSTCAGQIANQVPTGHNLLLATCPRWSAHNDPASPGFPLNKYVVGPTDAAPSRVNRLPSNHSDVKPQQCRQNQPPPLTEQHVRSWNQNHLVHLPNLQNNGVYPCKQPSLDSAFQFKSSAYPADVCVGHPFALKPPVERPTPSPPVNAGFPAHMTHYPVNGQYFQSQMWNSGILPTPNSDSSGSQDIAMPYHGLGGCTSLDCGAPGAPHYRLGSGSSSAQSHPMQTSDYMGGDFQTPYFRDQNLGLMGNKHRPPLSRVGPEVGQPGYR